MASVYLFSYIQRNPSDISSSSDRASEVAKACTYSFKALSYEGGGTKEALPYIVLSDGDKLLSNANNAIEAGNYASACIFIFAYYQKIGTPGETADESILNSYNQCKNKVYEAIRKQQNNNAQQEASDGEASITSGLGEEPPQLSMPHEAIQRHELTDVPLSFSGFSDAFPAALHLYENDFSNYKAGHVGNGLPNNFLTNITIADAAVKAANIYMKNNNWSFRFTLEGNATDENAAFNMERQTIETALTNLGIHYQTTVKPYQQGSVPLNSVEYKGNDLLVTIWPAIFGPGYNDEVIITHLH